MWGWRAVAAGIALLCLAAVGAVALIATDRSDDSEGAPTQTDRLTRLQQQHLPKPFGDGSLGISARRPADWTATERGGLFSVQSPDGCLALSLSAPRRASEAKRLREESIAILRRTNKGARVRPTGTARVGGIPTTSDVITFPNGKGGEARTLLSVGTGETHAYLTEIVVGDPACQGDLQLAQLILSSITYSK